MKAVGCPAIHSFIKRSERLGRNASRGDDQTRHDRRTATASAAAIQVRCLISATEGKADDGTAGASTDTAATNTKGSSRRHR